MPFVLGGNSICVVFIFVVVAVAGSISFPVLQCSS